MAAMPQRQRRREEQVVPTFDVVDGSAAAPDGGGPEFGTPLLSANGAGADSDYPIPGFARLYAAMRAPETGLRIEDRRHMLSSMPKCFSGRDFVDWMQKNESMERVDAVEAGQKLLDAGIMQHVTTSEVFADEDYLYRFQEDLESSILNIRRIWDSNYRARYAVEVSSELLTNLACLCEAHRRNLLHGGGGGGGGGGGALGGGSADAAALDILGDLDDVDYVRLERSSEFRAFVMSTSELQAVDVASLNDDERLCFFVNLYNTLCLHAHVVYGAPTSFLKRVSFFRSISYRVAGLDYSLDDIEHGILRGNKRPPSFWFMQQLRPTDPKCQYVLRVRDERIHFIISAGTPSDPPMRILDIDNLREELHEGTEEYLNKAIKIDLATNEVTLPKIFKWYRDDFVRPEIRLLRWVAQYLSAEKRRALLALLPSEGTGSNATPPSILYQHFDWKNSDTRFNAAKVHRERRRLKRERDNASGDVRSAQRMRVAQSSAVGVIPGLLGASAVVGGSPHTPNTTLMADSSDPSSNISPLLRGAQAGGGGAVYTTPLLGRWNGNSNGISSAVHPRTRADTPSVMEGSTPQLSRGSALGGGTTWMGSPPPSNSAAASRNVSAPPSVLAEQRPSPAVDDAEGGADGHQQPRLQHQQEERLRRTTEMQTRLTQLLQGHHTAASEPADDAELLLRMRDRLSQVEREPLHGQSSISTVRREASQYAPDMRAEVSDEAARGSPPPPPPPT